MAESRLRSAGEGIVGALLIAASLARPFLWSRRTTWGATEKEAVVLSGIDERPGVIDGRIEVRQYPSMTIGADHDILDGAPPARFTGP